MHWLLIGLAGVIGVVVLVTLIGMFLPRDHTASGSVVLHQRPEAVWATIRDLDGAAAWFRKEDVKVEIVEDRPPAKLVTRIVAGPRAPFGGTWTWEIAAAPEGARLTLTERGWIAVPPFRVLAHAMGLDATIKSYLAALARKFGEGT
jgi:hypothetical protein